MTSHSVELKTGCRIHFGLMELCPGAEHCFSGLGLALREPGFHLRLTSPVSSESLEKTQVTGTPEVQSRITQVLERFKTQREFKLPGQIHVQKEIPLHTGLGAGTQLACATAAALELFQFAQVSDRNIKTKEVVGDNWYSVGSHIAKEQADAGSWLTQVSGRGLRSAVGLRTFLEGGFVVDRGYKADVAPQSERTLDTECLKLPEPWRVLILQNTPEASVAGEDETRKIAQAGESPNFNKPKMLKLVDSITQSLTAKDFIAFTDALELYMELAAGLFEGQQGGLYNGATITKNVESAKEAGLRGVGQSSWGPTVFGFAESEHAASEIKEQLTKLDEPIVSKICCPDFSGAQYRFCES